MRKRRNARELSTSGPVAVPLADSLHGAVRSSCIAGAEGIILVALYMHDLSGGDVERQSLIIAEEFQRQGVDVVSVLHRLGGPLLDQVPASLRSLGYHGESSPSADKSGLVGIRSTFPTTLTDAIRLIG